MYRNIADYWYDKTTDGLDGAMACADFGMRGMSCMDEAVRCSASWLLSFNKTSTIPAISYIDKYYNADCKNNGIGLGAVSTEHSVMGANFSIDGDEITFVKRLLTELYPDTSFSMVSDTYDYWNMVNNILPQCRDEIMNHNGKLLVRPDSGDIVEISVKTVERLWEIFGGTENSKGYKVLDPHIGIIYGDGCTLSNVETIWKELEKRGFAANNIAYGVGAFCFTAIVENGKLVVATRDMFKPSGKADIKDDFYTQFIHTKSDGTVDMKHLEALLDEDESIGLVSVMYVNNETGAVNPVNHIGEICRERGVLFHTDCVQAAGCHPIDTNIIGCDFATISGHKIYAPKGIGAIYIKDKTLARSLIYGGANQEFGLRGGTENVAGIVGLGKACDLICSDFGTQRVTVSLLKRLFYGNMISYLKEVNLEDRIHVNGASVGDVGKTLNLRVENIDSETLLLMLDAKGVCISAGSACHSHKSEPSRVLTAMGLSDDEARDSVRISFSSTNTPAEVEEAAAIFSSCIEALAGLQR